MEFISSSEHEAYEPLICPERGCTDPQWTTPFTDVPDLQVHYCNGAQAWRWSYHGSSLVYQDAGEAMNDLNAHTKAKAREIANPILKHITEVLEGYD